MYFLLYSRNDSKPLEKVLEMVLTICKACTSAYVYRTSSVTPMLLYLAPVQWTQMSLAGAHCRVSHTPYNSRYHKTSELVSLCSDFSYWHHDLARMSRWTWPVVLQKPKDTFWVGKVAETGWVAGPQWGSANSATDHWEMWMEPQGVVHCYSPPCCGHLKTSHPHLSQN